MFLYIYIYIYIYKRNKMGIDEHVVNVVYNMLNHDQINIVFLSRPILCPGLAWSRSRMHRCNIEWKSNGNHL